MSGDEYKGTGKGWVNLGDNRCALEVPGGCVIEATDYESGTSISLVFVMGLRMAELKAANDGESDGDGDPAPDIEAAKDHIRQADAMIRDIGFVAPECLPERYRDIRARLDCAVVRLGGFDDLEDDDDDDENFDGIPFRW